MHHPRPHDAHLLNRPVLGPRLDEPHPFDDGQTALDPPEDGMLPVEPRRRRKGDEELGAVGVGPRVGHAQDARAGMLQRGVNLVVELVAVDGGAAAPGARRVAALDHEVGDDAVEDGRGVVAALDEGGEVLGCPGGVRGVELEGDGALFVILFLFLAAGISDGTVGLVVPLLFLESRWLSWWVGGLIGVVFSCGFSFGGLARLWWWFDGCDGGGCGLR